MRTSANPRRRSSTFPSRFSRGLLAGAGVALSGVVIGMAGASVSGQGSAAEAAHGYETSLDLREAPLAGNASGPEERARIIRRILSSGPPERFEIIVTEQVQGPRPRIVIIFDDVGVDKEAFERIMRLPGPVTLSFLPYAEGLAPLVEKASARGDAIMLHLPMEPAGDADPGPHALYASMEAGKLFDELAWNLARIEGYVGVNNHMGSAFTRNEQDMKRVLALLDQRGLFFIDSLTTGKSVAAEAGASVGATVYVRDVFIDAEQGEEAIRGQLALLERIARETGYAIAICHPRRETLDVVGPWLTSAPARGFELATVSALDEATEGQIYAAAGDQ